MGIILPYFVIKYRKTAQLKVSMLWPQKFDVFNTGFPIDATVAQIPTETVISQCVIKINV